MSGPAPAPGTGFGTQYQPNAAECNAAELWNQCLVESRPTPANAAGEIIGCMAVMAIFCAALIVCDRRKPPRGVEAKMLLQPTFGRAKLLLVSVLSFYGLSKLFLLAVRPLGCLKDMRFFCEQNEGACNALNGPCTTNSLWCADAPWDTFSSETCQAADPPFAGTAPKKFLEPVQWIGVQANRSDPSAALLAQGRVLNCSACDNVIYQYSCPPFPFMPLSTTYFFKLRGMWPCWIEIAIYVEAVVGVWIALSFFIPGLYFTLKGQASGEYRYFPGSISNALYEFRFDQPLAPQFPDRFTGGRKWMLGLLQFPVGIGIALEINKQFTEASLAQCEHADDNGYQELVGEMAQAIIFNLWSFMVCYITVATMCAENAYWVLGHCRWFFVLSLIPPFFCSEQYAITPDNKAACCFPKAFIFNCYTWLWEWSSQSPLDVALYLFRGCKKEPAAESQNLGTTAVAHVELTGGQQGA